MGLLQTKGEQANSDQISGHYCCCPRYPLLVGARHVFVFSLIFGLDFDQTYLYFRLFLVLSLDFDQAYLGFEK